MARRWQQGTSGVSFQFHSQQKKKQASSFIPAPPKFFKFTEIDSPTEAGGLVGQMLLQKLG